VVPFQSREPLIIQCWDWDLIGRDDFMGEVIVPLETLASETTVNEWYSLGIRTLDKKGLPMHKNHKKEKIDGQIQIGIVKISA